MDKIEEALWNDYNEIQKKLKANEGNEVYEKYSEERDKIRNELILHEHEVLDNAVKNSQIENNAKQDKIHNKILIGTTAVSSLISLYAIIRSFRFDENGTITSTIGKTAINNAIPKLFKK